jgi:hypothetical protein
MNAQAPYNSIGQLEVCWTPVVQQTPATATATTNDDSTADNEDTLLPIIETTDDLLDKPWTYRCALILCCTQMCAAV